MACLCPGGNESSGNDKFESKTGLGKWSVERMEEGEGREKSRSCPGQGYGRLALFIPKLHP